MHIGAAERGREPARAGRSDGHGAAWSRHGRWRLAATPDEHVGETFVGPMRLADYLPTRVVEVGLHTLDLQAATGQPLLLPASAANVTSACWPNWPSCPVLLLHDRAPGPARRLQRDRVPEAPPRPLPEPCAAIPPFHAMEMAGRAAEREAAGVSVIHLEVGQPSCARTAAVREAARRARARPGGLQRPGPALLRRAIASPLRDWYGVEVDPGHVVVTAGASAGFTACSCAATAGQRVASWSRGTPATATHCGARRGAPRHPRRPGHPVGADARARRGGRTARRAGGARRTPPARCWPERRSGPGRLVPGQRRAARVRRSTTASPTRSGPRTRWRSAWRRRRQQLLQVLLHDGLAVGLDHRATPPHGRYRALPAEPLHLRADAVRLAGLSAFDCTEELDGHVTRYAANRRLLLDGLAPPAFTDRPRPTAPSTSRRRVAPHRGCWAVSSETAGGLARAVPAVAGRGRGGRPRHRLRPRAGSPLRALLVLRT